MPVRRLPVVFRWSWTLALASSARRRSSPVTRLSSRLVGAPVPDVLRAGGLTTLGSAPGTLFTGDNWPTCPRPTPTLAQIDHQ